MEKALLLVAVWTLRAGCAFAVITALAPFLRVGWWPVRLCDFPRMQLGVFALFVALGAGVVLLIKGWRWDHGVVLGLCALAAAWQLWHVLPYTGVWPKSVPDAPAERDGANVRIAVLNLDFENESKGKAPPILRALDADVLVLIEINDEWVRALDSVAAEYPTRDGAVRDDGLGIAVWSRVPLKNTTVRHLATDDRASVWGDLELPDGRTAEFVALHPAPPGLKRGNGEREDSRKRDAELVMVAREVADDER
ncbi:MAG: endonuclease/exonuclease/phosphatase family protein, partial [Phycisphaerales bacterium]